MEVTVVKLRLEGVKLTPEQLKEAPRVHGFMAIKYWRLKDGRVDMMIKELILLPHEGAHCNPTLTLTLIEPAKKRRSELLVCNDHPH